MGLNYASFEVYFAIIRRKLIHFFELKSNQSIKLKNFKYTKCRISNRLKDTENNVTSCGNVYVFVDRRICKTFSKKNFVKILRFKKINITLDIYCLYP